MRIQGIERQEGAVNLTNGRVTRLIPVFMGTKNNCAYYYNRRYSRIHDLNTKLVLEIKRK